MDQLGTTELQSTFIEEVTKIINAVTDEPDSFPAPTTTERSSTEDPVATNDLAAATNSSQHRPFPIIDELFTAKILHQICGRQFTDQWLSEIQFKYQSSFAKQPESPGQSDLVAVLALGDAVQLPGQFGSFAVSRRDPLRYQANMEEVILAIGQYRKVSTNTSPLAPSDSTQELEHLMKDFGQYMESQAKTADASEERSSLFESILVRLIKLLYDCIDTDECRYEFYQIFFTLFERLSPSVSCGVLSSLKNVINTLASFDMEFRNIGPSKSPLYGDSIQWSKTSVSDRNSSKDIVSTSQTGNFDCEDICALTGTVGSSGGAGGGSSSSGGNNSSGYGRCSSHSTASVSSGPSSGVESLDSHPSPTPMFRENFKGAAAASAVLPSSLLMIDGHDSTNQLKSVIADALDETVSSLRPNLTELHDLPNLISPSQCKLNPAEQLSFDFDSLSLNGGGNSGAANGGNGLPYENKCPGVAPNDFYQPHGDGFNLPPLFPPVDLSTPNTAKTDLMFPSGGGGVAKNQLSPNSGDMQLPNQCYTLTLGSNAEKSDSGNPVQQYLQEEFLIDGMKNRANQTVYPLMESSPVYPQQQCHNNHSEHQSAIHPESGIALCDRVLLYRFIISQLLFDGHRSIANQLTVAERIKADGSLLSPNDRLHTLVTIAIRKEIDRLSIDNNNGAPEMAPNTMPAYSTVAAAANFNAILGGKHFNQHARLLDEQNYSKSMDQINVDPSKSDFFERASSQLGYSINHSPMMFNASGNIPASAPIDYSDVAIDSIGAGDAYDMFYMNRSTGGSAQQNTGLLTKAPSEMQNISQMQRQIQNSTRHLSGGGGKNLSSLSSIVMDLNNGTNSDFVLTEDGLKNLNQLAKMSGSDAAQGCSGTSQAMGNSYNRSVSSLAMANMNNASPHLSRSPVPIAMANNGRKTPISTCYSISGHSTGNAKNHQIMQIRYKFGNLGSQTNQFSSPHGFCLGLNDEIIIADTNNHRICIYEKNGAFKSLFGVSGKDEGQLWYPRKITMISNSNIRGTTQNPYYVICDRGMERSRMQIFSRTGSFVRKIPIRYIDIVAGIAVNSAGQIVAVDSVSPTIYIITETGNLQDWYDCSNYMREPSDIAIYDNDYYICDFKGHCVVVLSSTGKYLRKIGMEGLTSFPNGIDISPNGDIYVGDSHGNRFHVVIFNQRGKMISEYECPYVKVSRCCGLKLTRDSSIVTLAKNNHHVLVLNCDYVGY